MNTFVIYISTIIFRVIPETRLFKFKVFLLRLGGVKIGNNVRICSSVTILGNGQLKIGDNTWIGHQVMIVSSSNISIGSDVDIAPRVYIGTGTHKIDEEGVKSAGEGISEDIVIENGVWIGANSTILPGVIIGSKSIIAAGAVVTKSFTKNCILGGVPAKILKRF